MRIDFYGKRIHPPTKETAEAFGVFAEPVLLQGGQGTAYRAGDLVLKPVEGEHSWVAELFLSLPESPHVRFARPIKSREGGWVYHGYVAWTFLNGKHTKGHYEQKLSASLAFHDLLINQKKPEFLGKADSSWSTADLVAIGKKEFEYDQEFMELYDQIKPHLKPLEVPYQLIHGDLSGNFLLHPGLPPAVIDFSPAWALTGFAEGIMLADAIVWEEAPLEELDVFKKVPNIKQLGWRGIIRRITEQAEHMHFFKKDKDQALEEARVFQRAIDLLSTDFFQ